MSGSCIRRMIGVPAPSVISSRAGLWALLRMIETRSLTCPKAEQSATRGIAKSYPRSSPSVARLNDAGSRRFPAIPVRTRMEHATWGQQWTFPTCGGPIAPGRSTSSNGRLAGDGQGSFSHPPHRQPDVGKSTQHAQCCCRERWVRAQRTFRMLAAVRSRRRLQRDLRRRPPRAIQRQMTSGRDGLQ